MTWKNPQNQYKISTYSLFEKSKNSILTDNFSWEINFVNPNIFTSFSLKCFDNFSREIKVVNFLKCKTALFHEFFLLKNSTIFLVKSKLNFWTKVKISNSVK